MFQKIMKRLSSCSNFLKLCDYYATNIRLKFRQKDMLQTSLGGKVSLVVYIIMLIIVIYLFVDLNSKTNQTVYTFLNLNNDPPQINIDLKDSDPVNADGKGYFFFLIMFKNKTDNTFIEKEEAERYFYLETMVVERDSNTGVSTNGEKLRVG